MSWRTGRPAKLMGVPTRGAELAIWHVFFDPFARWSLHPVTTHDTVRTFYVFEGSVGIAGRDFVASCGALLRSDGPVALAAGPYGAEALVLQGRPIGEPVVQYGPFVMNDRAGINQVLADYQRTGFGGWPRPTDDSVHPRTSTRFARHADERFMLPPT